MRSRVKYRVVSGLDGLQANGASLNFRPGGTNYMDTADLNMFHGRSVGGTESPWQAIINKKFKDEDAGGNSRGKYPFFSSRDVPVPAGPSFSFTSSSDIVLEIRPAEAADSSPPIQRITFSFAGSICVPETFTRPCLPDANAASVLEQALETTITLLSDTTRSSLSLTSRGWARGRSWTHLGLFLV
jgi:hypothetical protein